MGDELKKQLELRRAVRAPFRHRLRLRQAYRRPVVRVAKFEVYVTSIVGEIYSCGDEGFRGLPGDVPGENYGSLFLAGPPRAQPRKQARNAGMRQIRSPGFD